MSTFMKSVTASHPGFDIPVELHVLDESNRTVAARIHSVSHSFFELICLESLHEEQRLGLLHEGRRLVLEVSSTAQRASDVYLLAVRVVTDELREARSELRLV